MEGPLRMLLFALAGLCLVAAVVLSVVALRDRSRRRAKTQRLPHGADAALWSIVEAIPDPRNHLALTRDLSGEVHLTAADRAAARVAARAALAAKGADLPVRQRVPGPIPAPLATPAPAKVPLVAVAELEPAGGGVALAERPLAWPERDDAPAVAPLVLRTKSPSSDHDFTEDDGDEDLTLTGQLFFAGPPELSPF